jgi:hypothetical protein
MNELTVPPIDESDARPFAGGIAELTRLAAASFTGIVRLDRETPGESDDPDSADREAAGAPRKPWLAMVAGEVRGVFDGDIETFEHREGTAAAAPDAAPVLLQAMIERAGEDRGDLHTEATLPAVEEALPTGFTGYIELIGTDLQRACYVVYDDGEATPVALEDGRERTVRTDRQAVDRARERASVYETRGVPLDPVAIPDPGPESGSEADSRSDLGPDSAFDSGDDADSEPDLEFGTESTSVAANGSVARRAADDGTEKRITMGAADSAPLVGGGAEKLPTNSVADPMATITEALAERDRLRAEVARLEATIEDYRSGTSRGPPAAGADGGIDVGREPRSTHDGPTDHDDRRDSEGFSARAGPVRPGDDRADTESAGQAEPFEPVEQAGPAEPAEYDPQTALAATTLLVRYDSLGAPTLASAEGGEDAERSAVRANRRLTPHTDLDTADARVAGTNFQDFLESSAEYRFVEWLLDALLFEIRATGNATALGALEEAIPTIDRADLRGTIDVEYVTDGETRRDTERFDVVFRDRMDDPLLVARLDESPSPVPVERVTDLLTAANRVDETTGTLAGAFVISGGYFEPDSLETAAEVTDSGFLSRDSRKSFIGRSRRQGYHLCLVEALDGSFHLSVPEL